MFIVSNFLIAAAQVLDTLLTVAYWLILIRAILSWVSPDPYNPIVRFIYQVTEPILNPIRRIMPLSFRIGVDISAIIAFLLILFLKSFLVKTIIDLAYRLAR